MEVIVLEGCSDSGKTDTLNIVYQLLLQAGYTQVSGIFTDLGNRDFSDVLQGPQKIGIVTQGDYAIGANSVKNHLLRLQSFGCDKAICACTLGPGKLKIKTAIAAYSHNIVTKTRNPTVSLQRIDNNVAANAIMKFI